jgi:hypothetical protein
MSSYKRQMPQVTKDKIRAKLSGRKMSDETKQKISLGVKNAWSKVPPKVDLWATTENNNDKTSNTDESTKV